MKIVNVTPGLIQIPPNGWGAVEKIIWEIHNNLLLEGYNSQILYLDDVPSDADIVHVHVANLANIAHKRGIPYYFTMHDHHAYLYGKDSDVYKENLEAIKNAKRAFVPAKYLVDYFDGIPEYFSHGVNTVQFYRDTTPSIHKLLCVANNGYIHNQSEDRKGFGIAIEAARQLGLPITIAGPSNNKKYFEYNPPTYDKLTILYDLSEEELLTVYKNHTIFLHPSQLEAGHPNLTLLEALSCGLPVVGTFEQNNKLDGMVIIEPHINSVVNGLKDVIENYEKYRISARKQAERLDWRNRTKELVSIYSTKESPTMKKQLLNHYNKTSLLKKPMVKKFNFNCIEGMFAEILNGPDTKYSVKFINTRTNTTVFETEVGRNCWARPNLKYYVDWKVEITDKRTGDRTTYDLDLQNKRVYIALDSKSLGDTLAWIPYVEEFRKKHSCKVICSTFWNDLFIEQYPEIEFVKPGNTVHDLTAMYVVGLFYIDNNFDSSKHPTNPITIPLQQIASDILGLPYTEIRPKIKQPIVSNTDSKVVTIATHSTAQTKYWNNPFGWQQVVDWLRERGYTVKLMSQEEDGYMGNKNPTGVEQFPKSSIDKVIEELKRSKVFIGVSSGLSWVSWAAGVPTVMISGFTEPMNEMKSCIRISAPKGKCSGCWNRHKFDAGDWNWCPDHKGTPRQFECSREITSDTVIRELDKILTKQEYTDFLLKNYSTWEGHGLFAIDLVERINPSVTVDLGVDTGFSTFCLAYSNNGQVYGIDTFQGDMFSGYRDTMSVVESVREEVKTLYNVSGINIIRGYFDDVAKTWDKPIDLLHIDGLHTYDAVKNDFETWTKFCKDDAIILFHDVETYSDTVGRFFSEINDGFKIIRKGSHGLGIYTKSKERFNIIQQMLI